MLIMCKSCKKLVDTNKHDFCPKCGSNFNYGDNLKVTNHTADYEEYERSRAEQDRAAVENRMNNPVKPSQLETQRRLKNQANQAEGKKNGCTGCLVAVIVAFCIGMGIVSESAIDFENLFEERYGTAAETTAYQITTSDIYILLPDEINDYFETSVDYAEPEEEENYPSYFGITGETIYTENYALTLTEVSVYENEFLLSADERDEYYYLSFNFRLENTTGKDRVYSGTFDCTAGSEDCAEAGFAGIFFPGQLEAGGVYEKSVMFKVPISEPFFDISFNDEVMIYASVSDIEDYYEKYDYYLEQYDY